VVILPRPKRRGMRNACFHSSQARSSSARQVLVLRNTKPFSARLAQPEFDENGGRNRDDTRCECA
jgi:hypothetical protein